MTLRTKTLLIIGLTLGALFAVLFISLSAVLTNGFARVENNFTMRNVRRADEAFMDEIGKMNRNVGDWAPWDDTYFFVQPDADEETRQSYIDNNLFEDIFANLEVNTMLFLDATGKLSYSRSFDLEEGVFVDDESTAISASIMGHLAQNDLLITHLDASSSFAGIVLLPESPIIIASQPILKSDRSGFPDGGTLIMARYLDDSLIQAVADRTKFEIVIHRLDTGELPSDFENALSEIAQIEGDEKIFIKPLEGGCLQSDGTRSSDCIAGYTVMNDLYGEPALLLRIAIPRDVFAQGQDTLQVFIYALLGVGLVFTILTLLILERLVLSRLARLSEGVAEIGASGNLAMRLTMPGSDELAALGTAINQMLQDLQDSLEREKQLRAEVQRLRIEIDLVKQQQQVAEITETEYFADLQSKAREIRAKKGTSPLPATEEKPEEKKEEKEEEKKSK